MFKSINFIKRIKEKKRKNNFKKYIKVRGNNYGKENN